MTEDQDIVAVAKRLAPAVRDARDQAEQLRQTPPALAAEITRAGIYQMYLPRSMGGPETPPLTAFRVVEELSKADGSVGWCAMIATALSMNTARLPAEVGRDLAGTPADYRGAGSARPGGRAWAVPGGYRVKGRWNFASGIQNARWLYCTCIMMDGDKPEQTPTGTPVLRAVWVPRESVTIVDTWSVMGMRGTGSQDFTVDDVIVPAARSCPSDSPPLETGPLYNQRAWYVHLWTPSAANALGIARGAIDSLAEIAAIEASTMSANLLRDRSMVQTRIAEADAIVNAARAYVFDAVGTLWQTLSAGETPSDHAIAQGRLAIVHAMHESVRAVDKVFHAAGTNAIYTRLPLECAFRDVHVAVQHAAALPLYFESAGKVLLGLRPGDPGW
ncbi:acyl-CoA dehydrogenase family protein [Acidisphaera sp. S103]|uniref:acyl-CoA dehydrogenase family protein n=1 Tax=Acidisphaera sp. S103 TaxID=1747223 RepID=UPI00131D87C8|nr:acyl-CoA dehydrogenase family protein [Acidisphaera sp. S103]